MMKTSSMAGGREKTTVKQERSNADAMLLQLKSELEWCSVAEEASIVAEAVEGLDGVQHYQVIEIDVAAAAVAAEPAVASMVVMPRLNSRLLRRQQVRRAIARRIIRKKKLRKKKKKNPVETKNYMNSAETVDQMEIENGIDEDGKVYPVKIAGRKVVDKYHFNHFFAVNGNKDTDKLEEAMEANIGLKNEDIDSETYFIKDESREEGFVEVCEIPDENGCSSIELEYGSGISIYESIETYDSENEGKPKVLYEDAVIDDEGILSYRCYKCPDLFTTKKDLVEHKSTAHKRNSAFYKCAFCPAVYKRAYKYHCHMGSHDDRFSCLKCHRTFVRSTGYKKHLRHCHQIINPYLCVACGQYFLTNDELDDHLQVQHPSECDSLRAFFKQCSHCRYQFVTELSYLNHKKSAPYHCTHCEQLFECNNKLKFHLGFKHKPQICHYCGKVFEAFDQYTYHVRYYHTDKNIKCPYCDEGFRVQSRLLIHIDVNHTDGHNYRCNQCNYTAKNYASVNRHRRIAHMPKSETHKNVCNICNKSFLVLSRLKVHMRSHSTHKPFVCSMCGRGYKFEYLLKRHERNPELCLRVLFPNGTRLERKGKRRCDMCHIDFASPEMLAQHMVSTHNVKIETKDTPGPDNNGSYQVSGQGYSILESGGTKPVQPQTTVFRSSQGQVVVPDASVSDDQQPIQSRLIEIEYVTSGSSSETLFNSNNNAQILDLSGERNNELVDIRSGSSHIIIPNSGCANMSGIQNNNNETGDSSQNSRNENINIETSCIRRHIINVDNTSRNSPNRSENAQLVIIDNHQLVNMRNCHKNMVNVSNSITNRMGTAPRTSFNFSG